MRYTTIQNWSHNVYNLVTQRAMVGRDGTMEWVDGNLGSKLTMKYPSCYLMGEGARGEILSHRVRGQRPAPGRGRQGDPRRAAHLQPHRLQVDLQGDRPQLYRGLLQVHAGRAPRAQQRRVRRAPAGRAGAHRHLSVHRDRGEDAQIGHEATVSKIGDEQLFYLMSRGLSEDEAAPWWCAASSSRSPRSCRWSTRWS
jgi:Fe-S cluster assembly protein SufB